MDIEPLWALGGWFLFPNCMAAATTTKTQTPLIAAYTKSQHFLLFLAVLFIFLLLISRPAAHPRNPYSPAVPISIKRLLLEPSESESTTRNLHPKPTQDLHASSTSSSRSSRAKFAADEHEVPSGPNPISN